MTRRTDEALGMAAPTPGLGRLAWLGLAVAGVGWGLLLAKLFLAGTGISDPTSGQAAGARGAMALAGALRGEAGTLAHELIESGFALAILGALRNGFGALDRFFDTVLARSSDRTARRAAPPPHVAPHMAPHMAPNVAPAQPPTHDARPWRTLPDGSVEVDTILGTRRFATMAQARDFI